jgi:CDGSH-type Zn-finger protein
MGSQESTGKPSIRCRENGPYLVKELETFTNSYGNPISTESTMALCRCGGSENKPFCDGTHKRLGFSGEKLDDRLADRRDVYEGKDITIFDNRGVCSHAGVCTSGCPSVWSTKGEPWCNPDGSEVDEIVRIIEECPSGALSYAVDGVEQRDQQREPGIRISRDGPYFVQGSVELEDQAFGEGASREHYALCRCGGSKNKPFCDGTHWYIKFSDDEEKTR